ncbi:MAG: polysaccharide pyruvyl transferase CsaB [Fimbriimonadaceae bacterium]
MPTNLLLAGYLGCGNLGDDAVMLGLMEGLRGADVAFTVLSGAPEETYRLYGVRAVPRKDKAAVVAAIRECDALVFPGGSVFQDATSAASCAYYSALVGQAKKAKKMVVLVGQGVGPLGSWIGKRLARQAFQSADAVAVRDPASAALLRQIGVDRSISVGADSSLLLPRPSGEESDAFSVAGMKSIGIAPRPLGKQTKAVIQLFGDLARLLFQAGYLPILVEMDRNEDGPVIEAIAKAQGGKVPDIRRVQTPMQLMQRLARMDAVVAMRLHAGILGAAVGVPPFLVSYDPKVAAFAKLLDVAAAPSFDGLSADRLFESFQAFMRERERNVKLVESRRQTLRDSAFVNVRVLSEALGIRLPGHGEPNSPRSSVPD